MDDPFFYIAPAILFMVLALPLYFKWIPQNQFFGYRISHAFNSKENWYFLNKCFAQINLLTLGIYIILIVVVQFFSIIERYSIIWFYLLLIALVIPWFYVSVRYRKMI